MPVPAWAKIDDNEVDEESPITESLMTRLRNQWAAFMGVDPTSVTKPAFTLPASNLEVKESSVLHASSSTGVDETAEIVVSDTTDDAEDIQVYGTVNTSVSPYAFTRVSDTPYEITAIDVIYSSGAPTGVRFFYRANGAPYLSGGGACSSYTAPLDNTYHDGIVVGSAKVQIKARASGSLVYSRFKCIGANPLDTVVAIAVTRKSFKSKS